MGPRRLVGTVCLLVAAAASPTTYVDPLSGYTVSAADSKREDARAKRRPKRPMSSRIAVAGVTPSVVRHHGRARWSLDDVAPGRVRPR